MKKKDLLWILILMLLLAGCKDGRLSAKKTDDVVSEEVIRIAGDSFTYLGQKTDNEGRKYYSFYIECLSAYDIKEFTKACNFANTSNNEKIAIYVLYDDSVGANPTLFCIQNYNNEGKINDGMYYLKIYDQTDIVGDKVCNPELYSEIEDIRELHVAKAIQDKADDMGIDWYSYWPDLEKVVIEEY